MNTKTVHEPDAHLMNAEDVWDDAQELAKTLQHNVLKTEPVVHLDMPFSYFLSVLDSLSRDELITLHKQIEDRLAI